MGSVGSASSSAGAGGAGGGCGQAGSAQLTADQPFPEAPAVQSPHTFLDSCASFFLDMGAVVSVQWAALGSRGVWAVGETWRFSCDTDLALLPGHALRGAHVLGVQRFWVPGTWVAGWGGGRGSWKVVGVCALFLSCYCK